MQAQETKTYTLTFDERKLRELLIKSGLDLPKDGPFSFSVQNGHLNITWSTTNVVSIKENI